jgi:nucleotide-binding universal stress UspA family protein
MTNTDILETHALAVAPIPNEGPIVVALKPLDGADSTVGMAHWLAVRRGVPLHVVSVLDTPDVGTSVAGLPMMPEQYYDREQDDVVADARARVARFDEEISASVEVIRGTPGSAICQVANERHASLIVTGTGRHGMVGRFLYGERALEIVRNATSTVLIVPPGVETPLRRAMIAVDFSRASLSAAIATLELLGPGAHLSLVHVEAGIRHPDDWSVAMTEEHERRTRGLLARFLEALPVTVTRPVRLDTAIIRGDPVGALLQFAEAHDVQLIACGRNRHPWLQRLFVGSVSAALIRGAGCSVLVAPEPSAKGNPSDPGSLRETVSTSDPAQWRELLQRVTERNAGRAARLFLAPASTGGVQSVENGYVLLSMVYDRRGSRADITLGDPHVMGSHLTHRITGLRRVETQRQLDGREARVQFDARSGQCTIDFGVAAVEAR